MSGLENTPPPGDRPGSHSLIYFLKGNLIKFLIFLREGAQVRTRLNFYFVSWIKIESAEPLVH